VESMGRAVVVYVVKTTSMGNSFDPGVCGDLRGRSDGRLDKIQRRTVAAQAESGGEEEAHSR